MILQLPFSARGSRGTGLEHFGTVDLGHWHRVLLGKGLDRPCGDRLSIKYRRNPDYVNAEQPRNHHQQRLIVLIQSIQNDLMRGIDSGPNPATASTHRPDSGEYC